MGRSFDFLFLHSMIEDPKFLVSIGVLTSKTVEILISEYFLYDLRKFVEVLDLNTNFSEVSLG